MYVCLSFIVLITYSKRSIHVLRSYIVEDLVASSCEVAHCNQQNAPPLSLPYGNIWSVIGLSLLGYCTNRTVQRGGFH